MRKLLLSITLLFCMIYAKADEGMWLPYNLSNQSLYEMQQLGCKLSAEQIFSLNQPSLKDAIVQFGGGCTGELISPEGLLLTNHHCGLSYVQKHATVEHDYLTDGFWALNKDEELPNQGLTVSFLAMVEDVTEAVLKDVVDEDTREDVINNNIKEIIKERKGDRNVEIEIVPFYSGNQYILFEYDVYEDVRLVCCPPWGIGKYGADTDNWTWPRHKGDFNIFRVYTDKDGKPAKYSEDNVPMKSKHYLPINIKGVKQGDYAMILGYPGSTDRYSTSYTVKNIVDYEGPSIVNCRTAKLNEYRKHMDADPEVFIKYASKQASVSNYWKYYIGQVKQLKRNHVYERRLEQENAFREWVAADKARQAEYGAIWTDIEKKWAMMGEIQNAFVYLREAGWNGGEAVSFSRRFKKVNDMIKVKEDKEKISQNVENIRKASDAFFKDYDMALDKDVTIALLNLFYNDIENYVPDMVATIGEKNNGDFTAWVEEAFQKSIFTDKERMEKWFNKPKRLDKDPIYALAMSFVNEYFDVYDIYERANITGNYGERLYMKGLMEMQTERNFYPDANFTMRLTYGTVEPYKGADAVNYNYFTTMDGVMAKYIPGNWEFDIPQDVLTLYENRDYGRYADENGQLIVNFITTNDITGGNSGSPVINGEGELIGLAFDGNWEAMSGDIMFEKNVQRTICMDARYLLWCIEKVGKATNIINELTVIE
ncbi:MAG: S46 family peptidase [Bacteroidales bacterium]|nr:S46 family peptidase [Bacteroidales bacterium]MCI7378111.1 S46 family peptidase [Bacteroidales bacterium]MDD5978799.1 S46 family peptidase [Bacteroidales bacterium]MDD7276302.1 S46 family peptidase [Bacteroidales bacterium]MDY6074723.1 S46 family peptidase [Bacteroidales bacterium]